MSPSRSVCVRRAATARHISLGGEGNALHPVLSSLLWIHIILRISTLLNFERIVQGNEK